MADNNILIKITSEANLDSAQKALEGLASKAYDLGQEMNNLKKAEAEEIASIKKQAKDWEGNTKILAEFSKKIDDVRAKYKPLIMAKQDEIEANKKSIKAYNEQISSYKTLNGMSGRVVQQLRAMRERLMEMEDAGEFGSQAFMDLSIAAGQLEDQIGDTQQRIRVLASDTKEMDAVMGLGDGLAGSFYIATSAAEVLGDDVEGLQKAFYKVQAVMSMVSGVQQVWNALNKDSAAMVVLNTALTKLQTKAKEKNASASTADAAASGLDTVAKGAQAGATEGAAAAQWSLNAAFAANPIGVVIAGILAAVAAFAALFVGIRKIYDIFTGAEQAQRRYAKAAKELANIQRDNAEQEATRATIHQANLQKTSNAEADALAAAKKRNASELEMAQIKSKYAKESAEETARFTNDEIKRNNNEVAQLKIMRDAKAAEMNTYIKGSKRYKKAQEELAEADRNYADAVQKGLDLGQQRTDALREAADAEQEVVEARKALVQQAQQANVDLMKEGAAKEIAQVKLNYAEQLKVLSDAIPEEKKLKEKLLAKQSKEIQNIRKKYAVEEMQAYVQTQKNALEEMSQDGGTEQMYAAELEFRKQVLREEADAQIAALDKENMSKTAYAAQSEAIRLQLARDIKQIDDDEMARKADNAKRLADIDVQVAENATKALTGSEGVEKQLEVWNTYYDARKKQLDAEEQAELQAAENSIGTTEVKEAKKKQIVAKYAGEREDLLKEESAKEVEINEVTVRELQRAANQASHDLDNANMFNRLNALKANLDAELALNKAQQDQLKAQYAVGTINYQDYQDQLTQLTMDAADARIKYEQEKMQAIADVFSDVMGKVSDISNMVFDALQSGVQAEMDALDEEYTTDIDEARKNANKKYITEEEYEKKKAALEEKAAKYKKAQSLTDIGIQTALAIMNAMATAPFPLNVVQAAIAAAMGTAQLAIAASKPLAQYEKGRNGGPGEYALVGEKGPEIMYVPQGASIIPHSKIGNQGAWGTFGVPKLSVPEIPHITQEILNTAHENQLNPMLIDYDRLGQAVGSNIPIPKSVSVNIDRNGILINEGNTSRRYLNRKYAGAWN